MTTTSQTTTIETVLPETDFYFWLGEQAEHFLSVTPAEFAGKIAEQEMLHSDWLNAGPNT